MFEDFLLADPKVRFLKKPYRIFTWEGKVLPPCCMCAGNAEMKDAEGYRWILNRREIRSSGHLIDTSDDM